MLWIDLRAEALVLMMAAAAAVSLVVYRGRARWILWAAVAVQVAGGALLAYNGRDISLYTVARSVCPYGFYVDARAFAAGVLMAGAYVEHGSRSGITATRAALFATALCWVFFRIGTGAWIE